MRAIDHTYSRTEDPTGCPSENALAAFLEGQLGADAVERLLVHVDRCGGCRALLAAAAPEGALQATATEADEDAVLLPLTGGASAGRYTIRRLLGMGGMGAVYLAYDPLLDREVALKLLAVATTSEERKDLRDRLLREAQAMARLAHPHVTRVHSVDDVGGRLAIAMEYVDGSTMRTWLHERPKGRPRPWQEVLEMFRQAGAGLEAAHAAGLVHRDVKPDNILVGRDGVVRVTDFGLACRVSAEPTPRSAEEGKALPASQVTRSGVLVGTPAYMAPEQLNGQPADASTDCFGFAVALYEALYGARPFPGQTVDELREAAASGRVRPAPQGSRVPERVRRALLRALAPDRAARFPSMAAFLAALATPRRAAQRWIAAVAALMLVLMLAALGARRMGGAHTAAAAPMRRSVAVLGFRDRGGQPSTTWLSGAFSELLTGHLGAGEQLGTRSGDGVARMRLDLALTDGEEPASLERVRAYLGVEYVVVGAYEVDGAGRLRLEARLRDTASGRVVATAREEGEARAPGAIAGRVAAQLRGALGVAPVEAGTEASVGEVFPSDPEAARLFVDGLARQRAFDALGAAGLFEQAAARAPDHAAVHAALARAHADLGRNARARVEAGRALELSSRLRREERLEIEALHHTIEQRWDRVVEIERALWTFFPDKLDYGIRLADAQTRAGMLEEARKTIDALRRLSPHNPAIGLLAVHACAWSADFACAREAARLAVADARAMGARFAEAEGLHAEAYVLLQLGETDAAVALFKEVRGRFQEMGDHGHELKILNALAVIAYGRGDYEEARRRFEEVLARARADGNDEIGWAAQGNLAVLLLELGELSEGMRLLDEQLRRVRTTPGHASEGVLLVNMSEALMMRGDLARAEQTFQEGLGLLRKQSRSVHVIDGEDSLARLLLERGDTERALQAAADALALAASSGSGPLSARGHATRGEILLAAGRHAEARAELGLALAGLDGEKQREDRMRALVTLARMELSSGRGTETLRALEEAEALRARISAACMTAREVAIAAAVVRGSMGKAGERDAARRALAALIADAEAHGLMALALSARLDLGELEIRDGRRADGRARLAALAVDADRRSFSAIARRARAAGRR